MQKLSLNAAMGLAVTLIGAAPTKAEEFHIERYGVACDGKIEALTQLKLQATKLGLAFNASAPGEKPWVSFSTETLRNKRDVAQKLLKGLYEPGEAGATGELECGVLEAPVGTIDDGGRGPAGRNIRNAPPPPA